MNSTCSTRRVKVKYLFTYIKFIRCKNFASITSQKPVMQAHNIIDCSAEPHLPVLWRSRKCWQNVRDTLAWKPLLILSKLTWYIDAKLWRWWHQVVYLGYNPATQTSLQYFHIMSRLVFSILNSRKDCIQSNITLEDIQLQFLLYFQTHLLCYAWTIDLQAWTIDVPAWTIDVQAWNIDVQAWTIDVQAWNIDVQAWNIEVKWWWHSSLMIQLYIISSNILLSIIC